MAPRVKYEVVILRLAYVPHLNPESPHISYQYRKHSPTGSITLVRDWFDRVMMKERNCLPIDANITFCEWRIVTGMHSFFNVQGYRFDKVLIVLGEEKVSWMFYQNMPLHRRLYGSAELYVPYCSCCLHNQYLRIMDKIREELAKIKIC